jgi:hypothetical protein
MLQLYHLFSNFRLNYVTNCQQVSPNEECRLLGRYAVWLLYPRRLHFYSQIRKNLKSYTVSHTSKIHSIHKNLQFIIRAM